MGTNTNSVGQLTAQMIIEAEQAMATLGKITGLAKLSEAALDDLGQGFNESGKKAYDASKDLGIHNEKIADGEKELRNFYKEQKLQDRVVKDSKEALLGLTFGIMAVTSGLGEGSPKAKEFTTALVGGIAAMQAGEFAAFGLGTAGKDLPGVFGQAAGALSKYAGTIGAVVGLGVGLLMFFKGSNEESKKAAEEGLKAYNDMLDKISGKMLDFTDTGKIARKAGLQRQLEIVEARIALVKRLREAEKGDGTFFATDKEFAEAALTRNESIDITKKALDDLYRRSQELATEINSIPNMVTAKDPGIVKTDKKKKEKDEKTEDIVTALEAVKGLAEYGKALYDAGQITTEQYIEQLRLVRARAGESKEGYEIEKTINDLLKEQSKANEHLIEQIVAQYELGKISADTAITRLRLVKDTTDDVLKQAKAEQAVADIKNKQLQIMNAQLDQAARIGNLLNQALSNGGDTFIAKLNEALQIAVQIAKILGNTKEGESTEFGDVMEIIGTALPFFLNTGTVPTSDGGYPMSPAQLSRANAGVLASLRSSRVPKGFVDYGSSGSTSGMVQELRAMRAEIAAISMTVNINNPITLGEALKQEMPTYNRFAKRKVIGD